MSGFANNKTYGDKGSNANWQLRVLQLLNLAGSAGLATEATQLQVLAALLGNKEYEAILVKDMGAPGTPVIRQVVTFDMATGTLNPPVYFTLAGAPYVPVGPLVYQDLTGLLSAIIVLLTTVAHGSLSAAATTSVAISIPAGAYSVFIKNTGVAAGLVNGTPIAIGEAREYTANTFRTLPAIPIDGTGTVLTYEILLP